MRARHYKRTRRAMQHWTRAEVKILTLGWGELERRTFTRKLGRTWAAIRSKANTLGLYANRVPAGYEAVEASVARTGWTRVALLRLLEARGVRVHKLAASTRRRAKRQALALYVAPDEVDEAVAWRARSETLCRAAARLHIDDQNLRRHATRLKLCPRRWLRRSGLRLEPEQWDLAAAAYRATPAGRYGAMRAMALMEKRRCASASPATPRPRTTSTGSARSASRAA